jgi:hypothetical protein
MPPLERETGFEPATSTLARLHSTAELFPHFNLNNIKNYKICPAMSIGTQEKSTVVNRISSGDNLFQKLPKVVHP